MMRQPSLHPPRPLGLARKVNCHVGGAEGVAGAGGGGGGYGFLLDQPHLTTSNNGYNDGSGCAGAPPPFGVYPDGVGGGGGRQRSSLQDEFAYKKEEVPDDPAPASVAADGTVHKRLKMSPDAVGGLCDDQKRSFPPDGVAGADSVEAKTENDVDDLGNRDRSNLAALKEEGSDRAAEEAGRASPGDPSESPPADNSIDKESGEQAPISGVQRVGSNNGDMIDIPDLPEIPELKFNEGGDGHRVDPRRQEEHQKHPREREGEQFHRHGLLANASGGLGPLPLPLPPAPSPSSSLPSASGMSRPEEEMSHHMTAGEATRRCLAVIIILTMVGQPIFFLLNVNDLQGSECLVLHGRGNNNGRGRGYVK